MTIAPLVRVCSLSATLLPVVFAIASCSDDDARADADAATDTDADAAAPDDTTADADVADAPDTGPRYATEFTVVDVAADTPAPLQLAAHACAGLYNRELGGSVYTRTDASDQYWLDELELEPAEVVDAEAFVDACVTRLDRCVRYSYDTQQELLPSILTAAAVLGAVPLDTASDTVCGTVALDATVELAERDTPEAATRYVFERYLEQTTGLAMLNPGYEIEAEDLAHPELTRDMPAAMVDFVFSERLFVVFLVNGCKPPSPENALLTEIVDQAPWPRPIGVYGYNNSWLIGGYLFEAQTRCLESATMGAIPTETTNLSFFSTRRPPITEAGVVVPNALEEVEYDPEKTYVAFVIGDGDNVRFIMSTRNVWLDQRLADCERPESTCPPITWSISPHLARIAPDVLEWYYETSHQTGSDYFVLPPSGHLYAYPTSMGDEDEARFAAATEQDARVLGIAGTVHWDWWETWREAESGFLPRYAHQDSAIRGVFPVNVPYAFPTFTWWEPEWFYRVLEGEDGGRVVVFRPRQWRGVDGSGGPTAAAFVTPQTMADELSAYPPGTVAWVYMTSDGGLSLENSVMALTDLLPDHVQLVSADTATRLALEASAVGGE